MRFIRMLFATVLVAPALSAAQAAPIPDWPIAPGSRVRVLSPVLGDQTQTGSVVSATSDTLVFRAAKQSISTSISTPNIVKIEVAKGTHTRTLKGALIGFLIGAGGGAAIAYATYNPPPCQAQTFCLDILGRSGDTAIGGVLGAVVGILAGTIVGARPTDTWVPVAVPHR